MFHGCQHVNDIELPSQQAAQMNPVSELQHRVSHFLWFERSLETSTLNVLGRLATTPLGAAQTPQPYFSFSAMLDWFRTKCAPNVRRTISCKTAATRG